MGKVIFGITLSLDGYSEDLEGNIGLLYPDLDTFTKTQYMADSIQSTGSVIMAQKEFDMAGNDDWIDEYEYQVPIFVHTRTIPITKPKGNENISFTFFKENIIETIKQAKIAAQGKDVNIIGSSQMAQLCLNTQMIDELHVDILPLLMKTGNRPFNNLDLGNFRLERIQVLELPAGRTHMEFKIIK